MALTKATTETMGILNMVSDLGMKLKGVVYADSPAALAIADRKGSGRLRHRNIRMLDTGARTPLATRNTMFVR